MDEFDGNTYEPELDRDRLSTQLIAVKKLMSDGRWRTLDDIACLVAGSVPSISARLRDLRKAKYGFHTVDRRRIHSSGRFEYRLIVND